jgi:hypothetical protein
MLGTLARQDSNAGEKVVKIAIIDDWQGVARSSADWSSLAARAELIFFADAFGSEDDAALALADFDIILTCASGRHFLKASSAVSTRCA